MRYSSKIFVDLSKSVSSSGVQFLITLASTPLMTRLYDPAAYATFGTINTMAASVVGIGLLSLPNAYPMAREADHRAALLRTMAWLLGGLVVLCTIAAIAMAATDMLHAGMLPLMFFPLLVLTFGLRQIMVSIATANADFSSMALGQILEPVCSRGGSITLGATLGGHPVFILASVAIGHLATATAIARRASNNVRGHVQAMRHARATPYSVLHQHHDFVLFNTASQQAQPLVMLGIQMLIVMLFSPAMAGHYILAVSILTLPISLIAITTSSVMYRHFIEIGHTAPAMLARHLRRAMLRYALAAMVVMAPIFLFGETIFGIAFGRVWAPAGAIASSLSIAYGSTFVVAGVQCIFRVTKQLKTQFMLESITCAALFAAAALCFKTMDFATAIFYLSVLWFLRNMVLLAACIRAATRHADDTL